MTRALGVEMAVDLFHSMVGTLEGGVAPGDASRELAHRLDPVAHAGVHRLRRAIPARRAPHAFDHDEFRHVLRIDARIFERKPATEGMRDDGDGGELGLMDELGDVVDVFRGAVTAADGPFRVPVAPQVGRHDVVVGA